MDLLNNLQRDLRERFDQFHVLLFSDYNAEAFLRIIPVQCDKTLVFFPLVEIIVRIHQNENFKISLMNFKREELSTDVLSVENNPENICILIRKLLLDTTYCVCKVRYSLRPFKSKIFPFFINIPGLCEAPVEESEALERVERR